jgi:phosphoribosylanthranilate isomerase
MTKLRVKICGVTQSTQARAIAQSGATTLGFICVPNSPRYVQPDLILNIINQLPAEIETIGIFADTTIENICQVVEQTNLSGVQLHGSETVEYCERLSQQLGGREIIKALRIKMLADLKLADVYSQVVQTLLLDAYDPQKLGGTGHTLDWQSLRDFSPDCPWLLAGGLNPENIVLAIQQIINDQPIGYHNFAGVDLSSGVEVSPGDKDLVKVADLFKNLSELSQNISNF